MCGLSNRSLTIPLQLTETVTESSTVPHISANMHTYRQVANRAYCTVTFGTANMPGWDGHASSTGPNVTAHPTRASVPTSYIL